MCYKFITATVCYNYKKSKDECHGIRLDSEMKFGSYSNMECKKSDRGGCKVEKIPMQVVFGCCNLCRWKDVEFKDDEERWEQLTMKTGIFSYIFYKDKRRDDDGKYDIHAATVLHAIDELIEKQGMAVDKVCRMLVYTHMKERGFDDVDK